MREESTRGLDDWSTEASDSVTLSEMVDALRARLRLLVLGPLAAGLIALGGTYLMTPTFVATTTFMPPQQGQSAAASALASLGALGGLAAGAAGVGTPADRYVTLMQSATVSDRLIDRFKLMEVYGAEYRMDARKALASRVHMAVGKKDGLITVEVEDTSPQRAADIANGYIVELRHVTGTLAVTEAQQRRLFFDQQLSQSRDRLVQAQQALQTSGFSSGALKAEPRAAAEAYARLKAEITAADVRLQALRGSLSDGTPEVRQQHAVLDVLRGQLARAEQPSDAAGDPDFIGKYREFKYQEALFELYARQLEVARVDEAREGALIQVVDPASPPERKSKPKRAFTAIVTTLVAAVLFAIWAVLRHRFGPRPARGAANTGDVPAH